MTTAIERVEAALAKAGAPCLWHGESTEQRKNGYCAQCARRLDKLVFDQTTLTELLRLAKLGERVEQCEVASQGFSDVVAVVIRDSEGRPSAAWYYDTFETLLAWIKEGQ